VSGAQRRVVRVWGPDEAEQAALPRHGVVAEVALGDGRFVQAEGPFTDYERQVVALEGDGGDGGRLVDTTTYRLDVPWFGWLFALPMRATLRRRSPGTGTPPRWAPPDRLNARQAQVLGLLAAASLTAAFVNTLFTQTVNFAAHDFGISKSGQGIAGVVVRGGILLVLPLTVLADRLGRRRVMIWLAWSAPVCSALGALAPSFWVLTASQAVGRPLGIALDLLIAVAATEEMPRSSRAYAVSVLAMASGLGAGIAVMSLPLADLGRNGWRLVYVVALLWLVVAADLTRRLRETPRFDALRRDGAASAARVQRRRFVALAAVAVFANVFVAAASFFQNRYLDDVRHYSGAGIALFTVSTATPASLGFVVGGRIADSTGRRRVLALALPSGTALLVTSFVVHGAPMWWAAGFGGFLGGVGYPAFAVYRTEMFPTARRGQAGGYLAALGLAGGSAGLLVAGALLDHGWSYGQVMGLLAGGQLVAAGIVLATYPETAHRGLEELNPGDAPVEVDVEREPPLSGSTPSASG
jgi:MFS family permease